MRAVGEHRNNHETHFYFIERRKSCHFKTGNSNFRGEKLFCSQELAYYTECSFLSFLATFQVYEWKRIIGNLICTLTLTSCRKLFEQLWKTEWGGMENRVSSYGKQSELLWKTDWAAMEKSFFHMASLLREGASFSAVGRYSFRSSTPVTLLYTGQVETDCRS